MHQALEQIKNSFDIILVDGNRFKKFKQHNHECIVKGDGKIISIAAASILAKTYRDDWMHKLNLELPNYKWDKNKGYPTKDHRAAIKEFGACKYHRMSFTLLSKQLELF